MPNSINQTHHCKKKHKTENIHKQLQIALQQRRKDKFNLQLVKKSNLNQDVKLRYSTPLRSTSPNNHFFKIVHFIVIRNIQQRQQL